MNTNFNYARTVRLISNAIEAFDLNLEGLTIYTEAATGGFAATAALAIGAGAETVYAFTEDSTHGSAVEARKHTARLSDRVGDTSRLIFPDEKRAEEFGAADVVTNTGFLRPIDSRIADWLQPGTAVPLMYEPWEFRPTDMDIEALWSSDVAVLGTNERDERVATQKYLRALAVKLAFECDIEVFNGSFIVVGDGQMASHAADGLESLGSSVTRVSPTGDTSDSNLVAIKNLTDAIFERLDALFVVDHRTQELIIGEEGLLNPSHFSRRSEGAVIVHICGPISPQELAVNGIRYIPEQPAPVGEMSFTTGYLGPRPIVDLHAAGLRIGAELHREWLAGADLRTTTERVSATKLASDFDDGFKRDHNFPE